MFQNIIFKVMLLLYNSILNKFKFDLVRLKFGKIHLVRLKFDKIRLQLSLNSLGFVFLEFGVKLGRIAVFIKVCFFQIIKNVLYRKAICSFFER